MCILFLQCSSFAVVVVYLLFLFYFLFFYLYVCLVGNFILMPKYSFQMNGKTDVNVKGKKACFIVGKSRYQVNRQYGGSKCAIKYAHQSNINSIRAT